MWSPSYALQAYALQGDVSKGRAGGKNGCDPGAVPTCWPATSTPARLRHVLACWIRQKGICRRAVHRQRCDCVTTCQLARQINDGTLILCRFDDDGARTCWPAASEHSIAQYRPDKAGSGPPRHTAVLTDEIVVARSRPQCRARRLTPSGQKRS